MTTHTLSKLYTSSFQKNWDIVAFSDYGGSDFKYSEIAEIIKSLHLFYQLAGLQRGDKIAVLGRNSAHWGAVFLSTISAGLVIVPILPDFNESNTNHILNHSESKLILCARSLFEKIDFEKAEKLEAVVALEDFSILAARDENIRFKLKDAFNYYKENKLEKAHFKFEEWDREETCVISYTSGTSGFTKGVMIPERSLVSNIVYAQDNMPLQPGHKIVSFLPMAHVYGLFFEILIGGAPMSADVEKFFRKIKFKYTIGYGMTECGPLISYEAWDKTMLGSAGRLVDRMEVRIDSSDPFKEVGEIQVRGENVMNGYYKNEQFTAEAFTEDGWFRTGDLGVIDQNNFIYIRGRSKNMILGASGQNIYPEEIEAKIANMPYVAECVVTERDGRLIAMVYPDFEAMEADGVTNENLPGEMEENKKRLNAELPKYEQVSRFEIVAEEFEKTPKKNIKRFKYV